MRALGARKNELEILNTAVLSKSELCHGHSTNCTRNRAGSAYAGRNTAILTPMSSKHAEGPRYERSVLQPPHAPDTQQSATPSSTRKILRETGYEPIDLRASSVRCDFLSFYTESESSARMHFQFQALERLI
jgi:hypothetical protein